MPVFFIRDGISFPDMVHALKPNPRNHVQEWCVPKAACPHVQLKAAHLCTTGSVVIAWCPHCQQHSLAAGGASGTFFHTTQRVAICSRSYWMTLESH